MKKCFTSITLAVATVVAVSAQQLPNNGFESDWGSMACWSAGSYSNNGEAPAPWKVANVGSPSVAKCVVAEKATGKTGSALKVFNKSVLSKVVPGYFSLGQPWSTAKGTSGANPDGGVFGGIDFTYRPDAVKFSYISEGSVQPTVVAYAWTGTYTQKSVPSNIVVWGSCTTTDMTDRDRNILGISTAQGGAVSSTDGSALICSVSTRMEASASSWTEFEAPLQYNSSATPQKFNIIFSCDDYFSSTPTASNSLTIDDVSLLYYSRLSGITIGGTAVSGFDSKTYSYDLSSQALPAASDVAFTLLSNSGDSSASVQVDTDNNQVKITVAHNDAACTDYDGASSHVYTLQFGAAEETPDHGEGEATVYTGVVTILANDDLGMSENLDRDGQVTITRYEDNTCDFFLPDFALGDTEEERIGDIEVKNVTTSDGADGVTNYSGETKGMKLSLAGSEIVANVKLSGTTDQEGNAHMKIDVVWIAAPDVDPDGTLYGVAIPVEFNGKTEVTAIENVEIDNSNSPVEYYNLQGIRVNGDNLPAGIYIRRQGTEASKILVK